MVGTVFNAVTVAVGASAGLVLGKRLSEGLHAIIFQALGLFTLGIGVAMSLEVANLFAVFLSLIAGVIAGHALQLDQRIEPSHTAQSYQINLGYIHLDDCTFI